MHPILARPGRLGLYLAAWAPVGALLAVLAASGDRRAWGEALALSLPLALIYAFVCLGGWWVCRSVPLESTPVPRLLSAHGVAAAASTALWLVLGGAWAIALAGLLARPEVLERYRLDLGPFATAGVLLFALSSAVHYLLIAFEAAREAERRALELQVLARDAQLKTLRAQVHPHFLFNSLNSVIALVGSDAEAARRTCVQLADFLRKSLALGAREEIRLEEELALADSFLAVEQVRFGARLGVERHVEPSALDCLVPPLVLQPLVENAVGHGIAQLVDGGTIAIEARCANARLELTVANPCDPDGARRPSHGLGLDNVRSRLALLHGKQASLEIAREPERFQVRVVLPERR